MGLPVEFPMILEVDNKGAADLCNNWSVGGRTRHVSVKQFFLRDLKEAGIIKVAHKAGEEMASGILAKSTPKAISEKHGCSFYGKDEYYQQHLKEQEKKSSSKRSSEEAASVAFNKKAWGGAVGDKPKSILKGKRAKQGRVPKRASGRFQ